MSLKQSGGRLVVEVINKVWSCQLLKIAIYNWYFFLPYDHCMGYTFFGQNDFFHVHVPFNDIITWKSELPHIGITEQNGISNL